MHLVNPIEIIYFAIQACNEYRVNTVMSFLPWNSSLYPLKCYWQWKIKRRKEKADKRRNNRLRISGLHSLEGRSGFFMQTPTEEHRIQTCSAPRHLQVSVNSPPVLHNAGVTESRERRELGLGNLSAGRDHVPYHLTFPTWEANAGNDKCLVLSWLKRKKGNILNPS